MLLVMAVEEWIEVDVGGEVTNDNVEHNKDDQVEEGNLNHGTKC